MFFSCDFLVFFLRFVYLFRLVSFDLLMQLLFFLPLFIFFFSIFAFNSCLLNFRFSLIVSFFFSVCVFPWLILCDEIWSYSFHVLHFAIAFILLSHIFYSFPYDSSSWSNICVFLFSCFCCFIHCYSPCSHRLIDGLIDWSNHVLFM